LKSGDKAGALDAWKRATEAFEKASDPAKAEKVRAKLKQAEGPAADKAESPKSDASEPKPKDAPPSETSK
jgi:hypothetical protein